MRKTLSALLIVVLAFALAMPGFAAGLGKQVPVSGTVKGATVEATSYPDAAREVLDIVNRERVAVGLHALAWNESLVPAAIQRGVECTVHFSHDRPDGSAWYTVDERLANGENLARGRDLNSPVVTMTGWMGSRDHRNNILEAKFNSLAVACVADSNGRYIWVQLFSNAKVEYTVSFSSNGGSAVANQSVPVNGKATKPGDPSKAGSTFGGWFTDSGLTTAFNFDTVITQSITLYAKWNTTQSPGGVTPGTTTPPTVGGPSTSTGNAGTVIRPGATVPSGPVAGTGSTVTGNVSRPSSSLPTGGSSSGIVVNSPSTSNNYRPSGFVSGGSTSTGNSSGYVYRPSVGSSSASSSISSRPSTAYRPSTSVGGTVSGNTGYVYRPSVSSSGSSVSSVYRPVGGSGIVSGSGSYYRPGFVSASPSGNTYQLGGTVSSGLRIYSASGWIVR